jgi:UDP-4-amino-4,6-dideoxy-N-acetyl-beta-L-altrosamine transaminase
MIPYGKQDIDQSDIDEVINVLKSDFITQGPQVPKFEKLVSEYCKSKYSVAVNSATSALHLACLALNLKNGDWLWTSPNSFVASANCALYCGASVDFIDIDPLTYNISVQDLERKLIIAEADNKLPKIIIPVHFAGQSCNMKKIHSLSKKYGFKIIEDASHAIGGRYLDDPIGNCKYSDITVFSFHPVKIITTGEGGIATTNNKDIAKVMVMLRSHGISRDPNDMNRISDGPWYYEQLALGFNYRMSDIHAALGISQIKRLDKFISLRHKVAKTYDDELKNSLINTPFRNKDSFSSFHLYVIRLSTSVNHLDVFKTLRSNGIGANLHYIPIHTQPYYQKFGFKPNNFPEAMKFYREAISLPMFPMLKSEHQQQVIKSLVQAL